MKITKKILAALFAALLILSCFSGCRNKDKNDDTNNGANGKKDVTLKVWHLWASESNQLQSRYNNAVKKYMEDNPHVTIVSESLDTDAYKQKISTEFSGNASGIDVFYWWGAGSARDLVDAGKVLPLDEYMDDDMKSRITGSTDAFTFNGKTYSVPMFAWHMSLYCNKDLFDRAGATIPENYDQLVDAVKKLNTLEGITPIASGAKDGWNAAFIYQAIATRDVGAKNVNQMLTGKADFDDNKGYRTAAERVVELNSLGAFGKNPLEQNNDDANASFISGKSAMRLMGSWFANQVYTDPSATIDPTKVVAINFPMTGDNSDPTDYNGGFVESFWVNSATSYADDAAKFCLYINEKMGVASYETGSGFSGWNTQADESNINDLFIQVKKLLQQGKTGVLAWDTSLDANSAAIHNEAVQTLFGKNADVDEFIETHEDALDDR